MMNSYQITIYWSAEDEAFIAEAPELPGCAADGATRQEAIANLEVVMNEWIETAHELNRPVPQPQPREQRIAA
jgi:predicted RNase H-like HicB family nuclease